MSALPPVFGKAKYQTEDAGAITTGDYTLTAIANVANLAIGDPIWTSSQTYTAVKYHGKILSKGASTITCQLPATADNATPKVWTAQSTSRFTPSYLHSGPLAARHELGKVVRKTQGGVVYLTAIATAKEYLAFEWAAMPTTDARLLKTFFVTTITGGIDDFTASWYDFNTGAYRTATVNLITDNIDLSESSVGLTRVSFEVCIKTESVYT